MKIYDNPQVPQTKTTVPSFRALVEPPRFEGLYKTHTKYAKELVDTFSKNKTAMEFVKKYDVKLVFYACKEAMQSVKSSIHIFFENPAKNKFLGIFGSRQDKIELSGWGNAYDVEKSLEASTTQLVDYMLENTDGKPVSGVLNQHVKLKDEEIQKVLNEKSAKIRAKVEHANEIETAKKVQELEKAELDESIQNLMDKSK